MIVNEGGYDIANVYIAANYTKVKVGSGSDITSAGQTDLESYVFHKTVTPTVLDNTNHMLWNVSFTGAELGNEGVSELGIFHKTTDKLLSRVTFTNTGVLASADTLTFTIRMVVG